MKKILLFSFAYTYQTSLRLKKFKFLFNVFFLGLKSQGITMESLRGTCTFDPSDGR